MIKLGCDKSGDSRILLVENKLLNIHSYTCYSAILLTKTTAAQKEDALSYHRVGGQHFVAVVFVRSIAIIIKTPSTGRNLIGNHRFISILFNPQTLVLNLVQNLASSLSSNVGLVFLTIPNLKQSKLKLSLCSV